MIDRLAYCLHTGPVVLLDAGPEADDGRSLLFHAPDFIIRADTPDEVPYALEQLDQAYQDGYHLAGYIAYEAAYAFEDMASLPSPKSGSLTPLIWFMATMHRVQLTPYDIEEILSSASSGSNHTAALSMGSHVALKDYEQAFNKIQHYLLAGDIYQANYTYAVNGRCKGNLLDLYRQIRKARPGAFGGYLKAGVHEETSGESGERWTILSFSPELFFRRTGQQIICKPMKGTAPRGISLKDDQDTADKLQNDPKCRAENLMIVDLMRNDLARVCRAGSVKVPKLFNIEHYPSLFQMTSSVTGDLKPGTTPSVLLKNLFPCGSVTGAPKIRAMQILAELEDNPRGVYCGSIGHFSQDNDWAFNVAIRTLAFDRSESGTMGLGSGIVADSDCREEYAECALKSAFLVNNPQDVILIETMLVQPDQSIFLLEQHLQRLSASAQYWNFTLKPDHINEQIQKTIKETTGYGRLRLLLDKKGACSVTLNALQDYKPFGPDYIADKTITACLAKDKTDSKNRYLYHKTTVRDFYDMPLRKAQQAGFDEILFFNKRQEVTEGAISNLFIRIDHMWYTPKLSCGLLPGTLRAELLQAGQAKEKIFTLDDLVQHRQSLFMGNSVRGLRRLKLDHQYI